MDATRDLVQDANREISWVDTNTGAGECHEDAWEEEHKSQQNLKCLTCNTQ